MKKFISFLLTVAIVMSCLLAGVSRNEVRADGNQGVAEFVTRLYEVCLGRGADEEGLNNWTGVLVNGQATGVSVAYGFIFSQEFQNKECSNEEYVNYMYNAFFGRGADPEGLSTWVGLLDDGASRESVFCGFANSLEFANLCNSYGIVRGYHMEGHNYSQVAQVNLFVNRLYTVVLGRPCDLAGMENWTTLLVNRQMSGTDVARGFFFAKEFTDKNLCDLHYVDALYLALMGRTADYEGRNDWYDKLRTTFYSREEVFYCFAASGEFSNICAQYGINRGDIPALSTSEAITYINPSRYINTSTKNNIDMATWARESVKHNWGYEWAGYGLVSSTNNQWKGHRVVDCGGLIKSYMWYSFSSKDFKYGRNNFAYGSTEDIWAYVTKHGKLGVDYGPMNTIPNIPGLGLYKPGHMGVYLGYDYEIDAMNVTDGIQVRSIRGWDWDNWTEKYIYTYWFKIPGMTYIEGSELPEKDYSSCASCNK